MATATTTTTINTINNNKSRLVKWSRNGNNGGKINNNKQYNVTVKIYNIANGVVKDVSATVLMQATSHEFYFIPSGVSVTIQKTDKDKNGYPIGFLSTWQTANAGTGSLLFKLMHKTALKGPNDGPNVGHSDIQLNLPIVIK